MTTQTVRAEVERVLTEEWSGGPRVVDLHNNYNALGTDLAAWVWPVYPLAQERQIGLGPEPTRYWREDGDVQFILGVEPNTGTDALQALAKQLRTLFRGRSLLSDHLLFRGAAPLREFLADRAVTGTWYVAFITVSYQYTYTDAEAAL